MLHSDVLLPARQLNQQDAVLLTHGKDNPAATALLTYLKSDAAKRVIRAHGYEF